MGPAFERAWTRDQRERQGVAEFGASGRNDGARSGLHGFFHGRTMGPGGAGVNWGSSGGPWAAGWSRGCAGAFMGTRPADVSGADRPLVAERHQNEQRFFERARPRIAEGEKRRHGRAEHDEIGLAARLKRTEALVERESPRH